ncbi:MAG: glycosyltransferase family 2 protein [Candidatus Kapabacteria bacterium]|nr:glycosyltransferase family 2 protein [Candidatus Kapabacteria bacterium]
MSGSKSYDLVIAYRIYPGVSKIPPIFSDNKLKLSELCLISFKEALKDFNFKLYAILDNCPDEYKKLFNYYFQDNDLEILSLQRTGNAGTFGLQLKLLLEQNYSDYVYFAEDDYFYLPNAFQEMISFIKNADVDFVSPYDHPDYYNLDLHNYHYQIKRFGNIEWRTAGSTCMTFLTKKAVLEKTQRLFRTYTKNNYDASIWLALTRKKITSIKFLFGDAPKNPLYRRILLKLLFFSPQRLFFGNDWKLWTPLPSLATHMDKEHLAPAIDWYKLFQNTKEKLIFSH